MKENLIVKIGITPSEAPFRITCLRTFLYINAIAENNSIKGGKSKIIFQIDNTNKSKIRHSNEEIIEFYQKMRILPSKHSDVEITTQTDLTNECEKYFEKLQKLGLIIHNEDGTDSFNIKKYIELYGSMIEVADEVNGTTMFDANLLTDNDSIIIKRSNGTFLYSFCAAVDTIHWGFTTLIRGKNKMVSAAFQNMYIKSLGFETPNYFHLPLLLEENNKNSFNINARSDIRELFKNGFAYMPVINYILNTGYGDQTDSYNSIDEFNQKFDIQKIHKSDSHFDFNILKKTCNRFYQHDISYNDYVDMLKTHVELMNWPYEIMNYSVIGYKHQLNPQKIYQLYTQMNEPKFEELITDNQKEEILNLINLLLVNYDDTMSKILNDKQNKKEKLKLIKYILSGSFDGLTCGVYKSCYDDETYQKRLLYVKNKIINGSDDN